MTTLVYKQTHTNDPDENGIFGIFGCMGRVRNGKFDSVIGVGGISNPEIKGKITWIGINPHKGRWYKRGPKLTFDHFLKFEDGPPLHAIAPNLAQRIYEGKSFRHCKSFSEEEQIEINEILKMAKDAPSSKTSPTNGPPTGCSPKE